MDNRRGIPIEGTIKPAGLALAVDIGGTKTIVGIVDANGATRARRQFATVRDSSAHLAACLQAADETMRELQVKGSELLGIGVTVPGLADSRRGVLVYAPFLQWRELPVQEVFQRFCPDAPVRIANDVNACALGERRFGAATGIGNLLWVTISTGIGSGILLDGRMYEGEHSTSGELGHVVVEWERGAVCSCGRKGCLEAHASGTAIAALGKQWAQDPENETFADYFRQHSLDITAMTIAQAAKDGVEAAQAIFRQAGMYLGRALSYAVNLLDPGCIVVGGGVSLSFEWMEPSVREALRGSVIGSGSVPIVRTSLGYDAAFIGAASLIFDQEGTQRD